MALSQSFNKPATADLTDAVVRGDIQTVKELLRRGADPNDNPPGEQQQLPLIQAVRLNRIDILNLLLEQGTHIDQKENGGYTALMTAAMIGQAEAAHLLIDKGAALDFKNEWGSTAKDLAIDSGYPYIARILQQAARKIRRQQALHAAVVLQKNLHARPSPFKKYVCGQ